MKEQITESLDQTGLEGNRLYHVVIIITDGNCHDMDETKRLLVSLSKMPFSAVVIGVGDGDFAEMEILDADGEVLTDPEGNEAIRDIVQLVQYGDFADLGQRELALEVLGELPDQFVDYMVMVENERHKIYSPAKKGAKTPDDGVAFPLQQDLDRNDSLRVDDDERNAAAQDSPDMAGGAELPMASQGIEKIQLIKNSDPSSQAYG